MTADVTREPTGGQELREAIARALDDTATGLWMGQDGPGWGDVIAGALLALPELAALLADADNWRRATTGDPTQPEPLAMQARTLAARVRELEATVVRVRAWIASMDDLARQYREAADAVAAPDLVREAHDHAEDVQASADGVRRALDPEPQP